MYNGIGLQTARGSGTNGYVQTNKFFVKPKTGKVSGTTKGFEAGQGTAGLTKKPNKDILEHDRKRQIHLKLAVLEDKLIEQGYTDAEISEKINEARATLEAADAAAEGSGSAVVVADAKVSDTQSHQVAARKEKQMETLRAALGIKMPGSDGQNSEEVDDGQRNDRKNGANDNRKGSEKREHTFLDRDFSRKKHMAEDLKVEKDDKKKVAKVLKNKNKENEEDESRRYKKEESRKKRHRNDSSDTDSGSSSYEDNSAKHAKGIRKKRRKGKQRSDSETDSDLDNRKKYRVEKKNKKSRRHVSGSSDSSSDDDTDSDNDRKRRKKKTSAEEKRSRRHDSESSHSSSDEDTVKVKSNEDAVEHSRWRYDSNDDSDFERDLSKRKTETKQHLRTRKQRDSDIDSDSEGEVETKISKQRGVHRTQIDDSDVKVYQKGDYGRGKSSRNRNGDGESYSEKLRMHKKESSIAKRNVARYDSDDGSDEKVEKSESRRHDSDDEDLDKNYGRYSYKHPAGTKAFERKRDSESDRSVSDKRSDSSDSDSDLDYRHGKAVKKNSVDENKSGVGGDDGRADRSGRGSLLGEKEVRSSDVGGDDRRRYDGRRDKSGLINYHSRKDVIAKSSYEDQEMVRSKRKPYEGINEGQQESKSKNLVTGNEVEHNRDRRPDSKFESESNARSYHSKDEKRREDYSRSNLSKGRGDEDVEHDGRKWHKDNESIRESRSSKNYEQRRGERRETREEEDLKGRKYQKDDEENDRHRRHGKGDTDQQYGSKRRGRWEEEERESKGHEKDKQMDYSKRARYDDYRSSERKRYDNDKRDDDRARYRD